MKDLAFCTHYNFKKFDCALLVNLPAQSNSYPRSPVVFPVSSVLIFLTTDLVDLKNNNDDITLGENSYLERC